MDAGEEPEQAVRRELLEEAGMESDTWELYKTYEPVHKIDWKVYTFIARNCRKVAEQKLDAGEKIEVQKVSFEEFIDIILSDRYWGTELALDIYRMKEKRKLEEFREILFRK